MDVNILRSITTVFMLLVFLAIVGWAWSRKRRDDFDEAAQLPLLDDGAGFPHSGEKQ